MKPPRVRSKLHRLRREGRSWYCACGQWTYQSHGARHAGPLADQMRDATVRMAHDMHRRGMTLPPARFR